MTQVTSDKDAGVKGHIEPGVGNTLHASQLQTMLKLYDKIQTYTFRLMATDSVPKFVKTERVSDHFDPRGNVLRGGKGDLAQ